MWTNFLFMMPNRAHFVDAQRLRWHLTHVKGQLADQETITALQHAVDEYLEIIWQSIRNDPAKNSCWRVQPEGALTPQHYVLTWNPFGDSSFADAHRCMESLFAAPNPTRAAFAGTPLAEPPPVSLLQAPESARDREAARARARAVDYLIHACDDMGLHVLDRSFVTIRPPRAGGCPHVLTAEQTRLLLLEREFLGRWLDAHAEPEPPDEEENAPAPGCCGAWLARGMLLRR